MRYLYRNVKNMAEAKRAMMILRKAGLKPYVTDAGIFSRSRKGLDVYAASRKKRVMGFKIANQRSVYI